MINADAVGETTEPRRHSWSADDTLLYALAVGAGADELELTTENTDGVDLIAIPTFAAVLGGGAGELRSRLGSWAPGAVVHGTQFIEFDSPLTVSGDIEIVGRVAAVEDKGTGALVEIESRAVDAATGASLFTSTTGLFIRGEGGFGGSRSHGSSVLPKAGHDREPDLVLAASTRTDQALLYRLCGDRNPLHSDPGFAKRAGFPRPILHGLCTWGITARVLGRAATDGDFSRIAAFGGRFRGPVLPGDELRIDAWRSSDAEIHFRVRVDDRVVIEAGLLRLADR
ncbi:hypothetical protein ASD65_13140 [Microbacterium sp. Root61]|nr:hypothetical protein ASD65_13140 [Microbacterium sp. Root61]